MQYKCQECNDSGSRDKLGTYLDCNACGTAATRRDLNDFVKSLGPTHPEDVALAIHQRALAMAPKQEADHINDVVKMVALAGWKLVPVEPTIEMIAALGWGGDEVLAVGHGAISGGIADEYAAMLAAAPAAPAAANGALTDEQIEIIDANLDAFQNKAFRLSQGQSMTRPEQQEYDAQIAFARAILAAAGPDAALVALIHKAQSILAKHLPPDGPDAKTTISELLGLLDGPESRAALSGAKGN